MAAILNVFDRLNLRGHFQKLQKKVTNKIYIIHENMHEVTVLTMVYIFPCTNKIQRVILVLSILPWKGQSADHFQVK